ncbi:hypothetical protein [Arthrobacter agilis]|uniref:hypothetical protein n=1 Tax=Arthrobacter agilis TaxID=37921 RepID=UPI00277FBDCD|nr:hypothetical protein [Arthrobacter agilis]MDQ0736163.1 hypothetical protein [Arthrobacter agilis]
MRFVQSRVLWFVVTVLVVAPILVAAHTEAGRDLQTAVLLGLVTAAAIGGLNAALLGRRRPGATAALGRDARRTAPGGTVLQREHSD